MNTIDNGKTVPQYAVASNPNEKPDYSEHKQKNKNWKFFALSKICLLCCNWLAVLFYFIIFTMGLKLHRLDVYDDLSIYTKAVEDWNEPMWSSFEWSTSGSCPEGTVSIGNEWRGTVWGIK